MQSAIGPDEHSELIAALGRRTAGDIENMLRVLEKGVHSKDLSAETETVRGKDVSMHQIR